MRVDRTSRWIARVASVGFGWFLIDPITKGAFSHRTAWRDYHLITPEHEPLRFYFSVIWCALMLLVCIYFGFIAKLSDKESDDKRDKPES
ncbi:hypothetical protein [Shewanella cyperi]|uniref:Uncharacterized protein n=1 Tax=Shewanella cyperi TaxID=2814292 RepID=A0A974XJA2_9GAMM|nr:hypothetical protein [Shewanella cyperi]QSX29404.1 hypothetical protein JYB88_14510 [Shewanella cyperi]QSX40180.1 hypothetical protein JYB84_14560 [Shewanella cyperi]